MAEHESLEARIEEIAAKIEVVRALMAQMDLDALHLTTVANTAWITAGATTYVDESVDEAAVSVLVTRRDVYVLTDPIEEPRIREEERLPELGFSVAVEPWHDRGAAFRRLTDRLAVGADSGDGQAAIRQALTQLRSQLTPGEQVRLTDAGRRAADVMRGAIARVRPGMTEHEAAALLSAASRDKGGVATVVLVGSDERISRYRHPLPTSKPIERYAMLVLCFRYRGLVAALTRSLYFGSLPPALYDIGLKVANIDARMISGTTPGRTLADMFDLATACYAEAGQPQAINEHHQGGSIAYRAREALATPQSDWRIAAGQAFAWNPSLRGAKSEDTILVTDQGPRVITEIEAWPSWRMETPSGAVDRPAILEAPE